MKRLKIDMNISARVFLTLFAASIFASACSPKQRPVVKVPDPDNEKIEKSLILGAGTEGTSWLYKVTVVKTSANGGFATVGYQSAATAGHFNFTKDRLQFFSDVTPYASTGKASTDQLINSWKVSHTDTHLTELDGNVTNREEEDPNKSWAQKKYFKIDFSDADVSEAASFPIEQDIAETFGCWNKKASFVLPSSLRASTEYLTFVVHVDYQQNTLCTGSLRRWSRNDFTFSVEYRYSFSKMPSSNYKKFVYRGEKDPMMSKFGFFQTVAESLNPKDGLYKNDILMNRWDPAKEHHYFFDKDFPAEYKWIYNDPDKGVMALTNKIFSDHGLPTRFYIHENTDIDGQVKEFGDIRYSLIKIVEEIDEGAPLGYGPTDAHPITGEILSGNVVLWTGYLKSITLRMKDNMDRYHVAEEASDKDPSIDPKLKKLSKSSLFQVMKSTFDNLKGDSNPTNWVNEFDLKSASGQVFYQMLPELTFGYPGATRFTTSMGPTEAAKTGFMKFRNDEDVVKWIGSEQAKTEIRQARDAARQADIRKSLAIQHHMKFPRNTSVYPIDPAIASTQTMIMKGLSFKDAFDTLFFRVAIHEFGHNLGLRHNFYGTVDQAHFKSVTVTDSDGKPRATKPLTSSVMDYLTEDDDAQLGRNWEPYDEAALAYAYSDGKIYDPKENFLYCTDEHTIVNAMCNQWDRGSTPSQVVMSLIENYEQFYWIRNYRNDRAYWNTQSYPDRVFGEMMTLKKFVAMWDVAYSDERIQRFMGKKGGYNSDAIKSVTQTISGDMAQALRLAMNFYYSVIQQAYTDRPFDDQFDPQTGEKNREGIFWDKLFAMMFLQGDDGLPYDPNDMRPYTSYLAHQNRPEIAGLLSYINESTVTSRVSMKHWFIGFARVLYGLTATDNDNWNASNTAIEKIAIHVYTAQQLQDYFGIEAKEDVGTLEIPRLSRAKDGYFTMTNPVALVRINGQYYMFDKVKNAYAYSIFSNQILPFLASTDPASTETVVQAKSDILDLYNIYKSLTGAAR